MTRNFSKVLISILSILLCSCFDEDKSSTNDEESGLYWMGVHATSPIKAEENWAYFNYVDKVTYIFSENQWDTMAVSGLDGISVEWQGALEVAPEPAQLNWCYYNSIDSCSYLYNGIEWSIVAMNGNDGLSITWIGELSQAPENPTINTLYKNTADGKSYIFNGTDWDVVSVDGIDGKTILWQGSLASAPEDPESMWAYYNSIEKKSYLFTDDAWVVLCRDGVDGVDGTSILWQGTFETEPENPEYLWAYYNSIENCSYIFSGKSWEILALGGTDGKDGKDGISVTWLGEFAFPPFNPDTNSAYYNIQSGTSFIWDGSSWDTLAINGKDGLDGLDGNSFNWLGTFYEHPYKGEKNDAYHNSIQGITYIYNGYFWEIMCQNGTDGKDADSTKYIISKNVSNGDSLLLHHNLGSDNLFFLAQYVGNDSIVHSWEYKDPSWSESFKLENEKVLFTFPWTNNDSDMHMKKRIDDSTYLLVYNQDTKAKYSIVGSDGTEISKGQYDTIPSFEAFPFVLNGGNNIAITYVNTKLKPIVHVVGGISGTSYEVTTDSITTIKAVEETDSTLLVFYSKRNDTTYYRRIAISGTLSDEKILGTSQYPNRLYLCKKSDAVQLVWQTTAKKVISQTIDSELNASESYTLFSLPSYQAVTPYNLCSLPNNKALFLYYFSGLNGAKSYRGLMLESDGSASDITVKLGDKNEYVGTSATLLQDSLVAVVVEDNLIILRSDNLAHVEESKISLGKNFFNLPEIFANSDNTLSLLFTSGNEIIMQKFHKQAPYLLLKKISNDVVALYNYSGRMLWMTLSLNRGRSFHPDAIQL